MRMFLPFLALFMANAAFAGEQPVTAEVPLPPAVSLTYTATGTPSEAALAPAAGAEDARPGLFVLNPADKTVLGRVEAYLGDISSISARFSQVSPDGAITSGKFYLQRPGKLRMEYDPPVPVLVLTSGGNIVYYDKELDQVTNISLDSTLVGFLARDKITFDNSVTITNIEHGQKSMRISLTQTKSPKDGAMTLEFSDKPLVLRNIVMTDSGDQSTVVALADAKFNTKLDPELFVFKNPHLTKDRHIKK